MFFFVEVIDVDDRADEVECCQENSKNNMSQTCYCFRTTHFEQVRFVWYTQLEIAAVKYEMSHFQSLTSTVILSHDSSVMVSRYRWYRLVVLCAVEVVVTKLVAHWLSVCFV